MFPLMEHYDIQDNVLNWFQSYSLSNCKQYVSINGTL